ncbi:hypothetical protein GCM10023191_037320 [Actinoallomurus oryzae]|uniref:Secreted protein n=1 Tax=Actinoallomurus oryzae TaxID=502180 RepID=A0ABP8Q3D6_9ACTN
MDALAAAGTAITVATATASASSKALSRLAAGSAAARTDTRRVRRVPGGWGMQAFLSGGVETRYGSLNKPILTQGLTMITVRMWPSRYD